MRAFPVVAAAVLVAVWSLLPAQVAHAELNGPCEAKATISGDGGPYETIDPKAKTGVYTVPLAGSAAYTGSIAVSPPPAGRAISGNVGVALPIGGALTLKTWSDEDATRTSDAGRSQLTLPAATPRGIEITVSGSHADLQSCSGSITVKLAGGLTDSTTGLVSLALTAVAGLGLLVASTGRR
jgi:hypothetical protein